MGNTVLVTGSAGLIGSEAVRYYCERDAEVTGVDNDMRRYFFGPEASVAWNREQLERSFRNYTHFSIDIRDQEAMEDLFRRQTFDIIIHAAGQPSHDWASREPLTDFSVNAGATLLLLELTRKYSPEAAFIFTSTNKVYGDRPNHLPLEEHETRWELPTGHRYYEGIDETMSIDDCLHSIFGASKVAADLMVQEYGRYFGLKTGVFRGGCLTGPAHSASKLHGFLAYLVRTIARGETYTIFGYKGKQVRDNIHAHDVIAAFDAFARRPRPGEVYNIGGTRFSNFSILEAIAKAEGILGKKAKTTVSSEARKGDHIWYISDMTKFKSHYPEWRQTRDGDSIIEELVHFGHFD